MGGRIMPQCGAISCMRTERTAGRGEKRCARQTQQPHRSIRDWFQGVQSFQSALRAQRLTRAAQAVWGLDGKTFAIGNMTRCEGLDGPPVDDRSRIRPRAVDLYTLQGEAQPRLNELRGELLTAIPSVIAFHPQRSGLACATASGKIYFLDA
jgi:hypothetical protein